MMSLLCATSRTRTGGDGCWFTRDSLRRVLDGKRVDILLVDAPHGVLCPRARQPAISFFLSYLKQDAIVLLHDTCRQDESDIAEEWSRYFSVRYRVETPHGFYVFTRSLYSDAYRR
jgi:hypothetical protein